MSTLIRLGQIPSSDRFDFMQDLAAATWVPMECRSEHWATMSVDFRASGLGAMQVVAIEGVTPITVCRTPRLISQADPDLLKMVLVRGGNACVVEQDGRQAYLSAGEFALYDTRRPYQVACGVSGESPLRMMTFMFPPSLLPLSRSRLRELTAVRLSPLAGLGDLTSQLLLQLARDVDHYSPAEAARLSGAALDVLSMRLARELDACDWDSPEARRHALLTSVQAFIKSRLGDPDLSPAGIATAHHISLRSLHQLFHDEGLTVAGWIRQQRLERCRRDLADPDLAHRPVAAIAGRWGYSSPGDFSRAFRAAHGLPPAEYRRSARVVKTSAR